MPGHVAFSRTPRKLLKMERRIPQIIHYLSSFAVPYQPDILCLQEVDRYKLFYNDELIKLGYDGRPGVQTATVENGKVERWMSRGVP